VGWRDRPQNRYLFRYRLFLTQKERDCFLLGHGGQRAIWMPFNLLWWGYRKSDGGKQESQGDIPLSEHLPRHVPCVGEPFHDVHLESESPLQPRDGVQGWTRGWQKRQLLFLQSRPQVHHQDDDQPGIEAVHSEASELQITLQEEPEFAARTDLWGVYGWHRRYR